MSDKKKGMQEGPPIWVESLMTSEEWREGYKTYPGTYNEPDQVPYDNNYHKGGKWRGGMGYPLSKRGSF